MTTYATYTAQTQTPAPATTAARRDKLGLILNLATVTTGLVAGVYFAFATAVMLGLGKSSDRTFIEALQNINVAIENPAFFTAFFGAFILLVAAVARLRRRGPSPALRWTVAALVLYTVGFLITMGANVPLNNKLAAAGNPAKIADPAAVRAQFENVWNAWNIARTMASAAALACLGKALRAR